VAGRTQPGKVAALEREAATAQQIPLLPCGRGGCKNPAKVKVAERWVCFACRDELRSDESQKFCESKGLRTIDEKRDYCKRMARSFGRSLSFEGWAKAIKQEAVDFLARDDSTGSREALERLKAEGAIDGRNKVIPLEARAVAKEATAPSVPGRSSRCRSSSRR
jgi:hypothetical protein